MIGAFIDEVIRKMGSITNDRIRWLMITRTLNTGLLMCGQCHTNKQKKYHLFGSETVQIPAVFTIDPTTRSETEHKSILTYDLLFNHAEAAPAFTMSNFGLKCGNPLEAHEIFSIYLSSDILNLALLGYSL